MTLGFWTLVGLVGGQVVAGVGRQGLGGGGSQVESVFFGGETELSVDGGLLLGEGDRDGLGEVRGRSAETVLVGLPLDGVDVVVGSDVLVRSPHDDDVGVSDELDLTDGLLLDAVLALEGVVPVVVASSGTRSIENARKDPTLISLLDITRPIGLNVELLIGKQRGAIWSGSMVTF